MTFWCQRVQNSPSEGATITIFRTCSPGERLWLVSAVQDNDCFTFSYFQSPSPTLPRAQLYPIDIPSSSPSARGFEICFPIFPLDCLVSKPFLCCKPRHLSRWLAAYQAKESGSVTAFALFGCSESSSQAGDTGFGKMFFWASCTDGCRELRYRWARCTALEKSGWQGALGRVRRGSRQHRNMRLQGAEGSGSQRQAEESIWVEPRAQVSVSFLPHLHPAPGIADSHLKVTEACGDLSSRPGGLKRRRTGWRKMMETQNRASSFHSAKGQREGGQTCPQSASGTSLIYTCSLSESSLHPCLQNCKKTWSASPPPLNLPFSRELTDAMPPSSLWVDLGESWHSRSLRCGWNLHPVEEDTGVLKVRRLAQPHTHVMARPGWNTAS